MTTVILAAPVSVAPISAPSIDYGAILPILIILGAACLGVLVEALLKARQRYAAQVALTVTAIVAAGVVTVLQGTGGHYAVTLAGALSIDQATYAMWGVLLALALASVLLMADRTAEPGGAFVAQAAPLAAVRERARTRTIAPMQTEVFPLALFATGGMLIFPASADLITLFVGLEVLSLPLYLMCGLARRRRLISQEAAVKYFLLGAFASAILLYGIALLYGYAGSLRYADIGLATQAGGRTDALLFGGLALLMVGLLFKGSVGPFHTWTPDVYQGAPTPVTAFMASCTKVAAFAAMARVLYSAFAPSVWDWKGTLWGVAIASMLIGAILGITQSDVKRMLAYSSVAHAGFLLLGVMALTSDGVTGTLFYLLTYGFATIGTLALVMLVRNADGEATQVSQWAGLARRSPWVAGLMTLFLLSFAGIPLTSGFIGKLTVFSAAMEQGMGPLVVVAMVATAITAFFYLKIVVLMFFAEPVDGGPAVTVPSPFVLTVVVVCGVVTLGLGLYPSAALDVLAVQVPLLS
ncbi:NADH-quinone oxidoreductase subunit NuoN [Nakamurella deserti]|uniref:NADH-quinone oxidoreductase subunit NuoN n=1 Tax=Nakamurella deserti TaxID=2164074 RepID=UPI000DBE86FE|nr:NADH-quinone oxidoreductase subunit NuoN [Nakamurella deserti]